MMNDFINYANQMFPNIDTNIKNGIRDFINQFDLSKPNWFSDNFDKLIQGDIVGMLPFEYLDEDGNDCAFMACGMVLSNSCDLTRDEYIEIAPLIKISDYLSDELKNDIRKNIVSGKFCLNFSEYQDYYVDFSRSKSFRRTIILKLLNDNKIQKQKSLSQFGFYFMLCKISIYYLRVENYKLYESRNKNFLIND